MTTESVRGIFGCEPEKISTNVISFNPGSICEYYGGARYDFTGNSSLDLSNNGLGGLDTGAPMDGDGIYIYCINNTVNSSFGFIASKAIAEGDVIYPTGYSFVRKLPVGFIYNSGWDGIPDFHLTHWPMPEIRMTSSETSGLWCALANGNASDWTAVDLSSWIPDNARMAHIQTRLTYTSGSSASAYIRSDGFQTTGRIVGSVSSIAPYAEGERKIRTTSARQIYYKASPGIKLNIYVLGFSQTDPS